MGDAFTGGDHEKWDHPWPSLCVACKGYPQEHTRDEHCLVGPENPLEIMSEKLDAALLRQADADLAAGRTIDGRDILGCPDVAGRDLNVHCDPGCEED